MSRIENVSRFVAALASNPNHSNETVPNIVDMAEELADEVEKRPGFKEWGTDNAYPEECLDIKHQRILKKQHELDEAFEFINDLKPGQRLPLNTIQWITAVMCLIIAAVLLGYGFYNACRWVWNFYS